ncbi:hypothetical protein C8R44DRAFT_632337 [Mycena epipterygia]|nr:hypothetical protein C8R44DRAFT_632337 [Mycena epipterygia]
MRKWLSGVFHNQEWECFEAIMCLVFGEPILYAQLSAQKSILFQTMISPLNDSSTKGELVPSSTLVSALMLSNFGDNLAEPTPSVPVYDARKVVVDFDTDLDRLATALPLFVGEVPFGSFVVIGYTVSVYRAGLNGGSEKVPHLGCNIMWAIVCGTPVMNARKKN